MIAGGGVRRTGPAIMEFGGSDGRGFLLRPHGSPSKTFIAGTGFSGEVPDPGVECAQEGQHVSAPAGVPAVVELPPGGIARKVSMTGPGGRKLRGCFIRDSFLPDQPLRPHTTYHAKALWSWFEDSKVRTFSWTFRTR